MQVWTAAGRSGLQQVELLGKTLLARLVCSQHIGLTIADPLTWQAGRQAAAVSPVRIAPVRPALYKQVSMQWT